MASGGKQVVFNNLEREVASDYNRLQAHASRHLSDALRYLFLAASDETTSAGAESAPSTPPTGLFLDGGAVPRCIVLNGLRAQPQNASVNMLVTAGACVFLDPDANPNHDDSPVRLIVSSGQPLSGALTLTANASGSTRVDVVEFTRSDEVVETDSRDVFDPTTGLFAPATLNKAVETRLVWRIRVGTPAGGYPGTVDGWVPVTVASVPDGATTWNDVELWDVRPLASDLAVAGHWVSQTYPHRRHAAWRFENTLALGHQLHGIIETERGPWLAGGRVTPDPVSVAAGATGLIVSTNADVVEPGFVGVASSLWYLWAAFPFGLPRWCRYTPASAGARVPCAFRGIPLKSMTGPANLTGAPSATLALPTALGLGGSTSDAALIVVGAFTTAVTYIAMVGEGRFTHLSGPSTSIVLGLIIDSSAVPVVSSYSFRLTSGTHHPANAVSLHLEMTATVDFLVSGAMVADSIIRYVNFTEPVAAPAAPALTLGFVGLREEPFAPYYAATPGTYNWVEKFGAWVPLAAAPDFTGAVNRDVTFVVTDTSGNTTVTFATQQLFVRGWELGP